MQHVFIYIYIYLYIHLNTYSFPIHHPAFFMILSVQFSCSVMSNLATPWTAALQVSLTLTKSQSIPKLISIESMMPSNHLILCCPLLLLPSIVPSIWGFFNESVLHIRWPKYWSFSFSNSPSNEYSGLISFRLDWLDLLAVQGTLKRLPQHHSSKSSILQCSAFFDDTLVENKHNLVKSNSTYSASAPADRTELIGLLLNVLTLTSHCL